MGWDGEGTKQVSYLTDLGHNLKGEVNQVLL